MSIFFFLPLWYKFYEIMKMINHGGCTVNTSGGGSLRWTLGEDQKSTETSLLVLEPVIASKLLSKGCEYY